MSISQDYTMLGALYKWERSSPEKIALRQPLNGVYRDHSWRQFALEVRTLAAWLKSTGLPPGSHIGIVSKNCSEWLITDLAIMMAGYISVPFFPTLTADQLRQVMVHSECKLLFVGKLDGWEQMKPGVPEGVKCISFPTYNPDPEHVQWNDILASHSPIEESPLPDLDQLMTVVYTSGTTGNPKGVMLTFGHMARMIKAILPHFGNDIANARFISYLPLCHIAERAYLQNGGLIIGGTFHFVESLDSFNRDMVNARPTHFGTVPRIWTKFQQGILSKMPQQKLDLLLRIPLVNNLVKAKIRKALGIEAAKLIVVGAAPMPIPLLNWFSRLGVVIREAYGMSENTGAVSIMPATEVKQGTVGRIHEGVELKFAEGTGEILVRTPWNMLGYYKEPEMTCATIDAEGWLHTGDVGEFDEDGFLKITGRVKEMYKTSKGEYIAPAQIELKLSGNQCIEQVCVVGDGLPQPMALVVLSDIGRKMGQVEVQQSLQATIEVVNPVLKPYERVQKVVVMQEGWSIENGKLTPTLKVKRNMIEKEFAERFESWYREEVAVLWA
ncbi:AMP-binding protein [Flavihumibacter rivuli]|uniref:AMP-binding protein n=1 Tax=Flavihumibacter rivuli TaxID=2838156 RepID=UPI001BDE5B37|nr:AMP-binding protein [Flavihumibacter rivuli]ULQ56593.1 AMP-binding protein [Flavihumibacter rivuli]